MPESLDMAAGDLSASDALAALDSGLYIGNLWYLNLSDRPACRMRHDAFPRSGSSYGKIVAPVNVMRFDDSLFRLLGDRLVGLTSERELVVDANSYRSRNVGSMRLPGAVVSEMAFTL
jgi:predicted Zn-dependent protease